MGNPDVVQQKVARRKTPSFIRIMEFGQKSSVITPIFWKSDEKVRRERPADWHLPSMRLAFLVLLEISIHIINVVTNADKDTKTLHSNMAINARQWHSITTKKIVDIWCSLEKRDASRSKQHHQNMMHLFRLADIIADIKSITTTFYTWSASSSSVSHNSLRTEAIWKGG